MKIIIITRNSTHNLLRWLTYFFSYFSLLLYSLAHSYVSFLARVFFLLTVLFSLDRLYVSFLARVFLLTLLYYLYHTHIFNLFSPYYTLLLRLLPCNVRVV